MAGHPGDDPDWSPQVLDWLPPDDDPAEFDVDPDWPYRPSREDKAYPVLTLRESATACGLVRKANGRLSPTVAGRALLENRRALLKHIQDRLPLGRRDSQKDAGLIAWLFAATGQDLYAHADPAAELFSDLGWAARDGRPALALRFDAAPTRAVLKHLADPLEGEDSAARIAKATLHSQ